MSCWGRSKGPPAAKNLRFLDLPLGDVIFWRARHSEAPFGQSGGEVPTAVEVKIISASFKNPNVTSGEAINVYAKTSDNVERIELINEEGESCAQTSGNPTTRRNGEKELDFTWGTVKTGNRLIMMKAYGSGKYDTASLSAL